MGQMNDLAFVFRSFTGRCYGNQSRCQIAENDLATFIRRTGIPKRNADGHGNRRNDPSICGRNLVSFRSVTGSSREECRSVAHSC